jgi:hypothetical protein
MVNLLINSSRLVRCAALCLALLGLALGRLLVSQVPSSTTTVRPETLTVPGSAPAQLLQRSKDLGRVSSTQNLGKMVLVLAPSPEQEAAAAKFVSAQSDPSSPTFHHWLTSAQFGAQFGVSEESASTVTRWLKASGLTVHDVAQSRRFVIFSGNVAQVENAFSTQMHAYSLNDKSFISNAGDIQIPADLRSIVKGVVRLHSDPKEPALVLGKKVPFQKTSGQFTFGDGSHYLAPADVAKIYNIKPLYDAGFDGTGQSIAIVGRSNIDVQNVRDFRSVLGLPANDPQIIVNGDDPGQSGDATEAMLDITWSGAVAPMAQIKFVVSQSNFSDGVDVSAAYIVDRDLAPVMSMSYGACESNMGPTATDFYNALWQQAAAEGITAFVSSGDNGGAGCDAPGGGVYSSGVFAVNGIASTPYNIAVGGTQFDDTANPGTYWSSNTNPVTGESVLGYIPERVWNESSNDPNNISLYASGGGASNLYPKPEWQVGNGVPNDGARDLPDISFTAALHDGYLFCFYSSCSNGDYFYTAGGTSVSSPVAAGIMALVNQKIGQPQGLANYVFYRLASVPGIYNDTVNGDNKVPGPDGQFTVGYDATAGYDLATGLGSFDANALASHWQAAVSSTASNTTLTLANGQSSTVVHGSSINLNASVACAGGSSCKTPVGSVALSASSSTGPGLGAGATTLDSSGTAAIHAASVPGGSYALSARYSGDGTYSPSTSAAVPVTVTPEGSRTLVGSIGGGNFIQGPITIEYGLAWNVGIAVAGQSGQGYPSGNLHLTADGQPLTTYSYDPGTGNLTPSALTLNYGEKASLLTSQPSSQASTISYVVASQSLGAGSHTLTAVYPGDASFSSSQGSYTYNVVRARSAIEDFFPVGDQVANTPIALAGQVGFTNNGYAPYGGTVTISDITDATPVVLGTGTLDSTYGGSYSVPVTVKTVGNRSIKVDFSGDANVAPSFQTYTVPFPANDPSYTALTTDTPNPVAGQPVTLTANVSSNVRLYTATGTVTFLTGSTTVGTATLDSNGNAVLVTSALPDGPISLTASYPGDAILQPSVSDASNANVADYVLQALPASLIIKEGQSTTASLNLVPIGGFSGAVSLSCSGMPAHGSCTLASPSATLDGLHPVTVSVVINTAATTAGLMNKELLLKLPSSVVLAALILWPLRRRKWLPITLSLLLVICFAGIGCGGNSHSNQAAVGTYQVKITATGGLGQPSKTATFAVTVTP